MRLLRGCGPRNYNRKTRVHNLGRFHVSVLLQNGQSLLLVSKGLGYASIAATGDIYGQLLPGWQK